MQRDQFRFGRQWKRLSSNLDKSEPGFRDSIEAFTREVEQSLQLRQRRHANLPQINYDQSLPIFERRDEIAAAINENQVTVISGETGSGKSTQLPLIALENGYGVRGFVGHTQPRRIAARSVAARIASQLNSSLGHAVGFKIRFDDKSSEETYIKLMTDGILLAESQSDRFFDQYDMIIVDEAHERSLNIDFLIGNLKRVLTKRPALKVVITSATIDTERFAEHFRTAELPAPVIKVEGRTYPVEVRYQPINELQESDSADPNDHIVSTVKDLVKREDGDILVFLPTEKDIRTVSRKLKGGFNADVLPLYARLTTEQQNAIFETGKRRRIVLSTNVAESSVTVPGIRVVVDSGTARISRYAPRSKVQRLPIEAVSQASADQRAGRCGRIGPGICVRLYSEEDFESRPKFTTPEIRRTNLASVILQTLALKLGDIAEFPFIDPPHPESIADGYRTLFEIGAIESGRRLTKLGRWLAKLPLDPRIGRMIHAAVEENCLNEILIIASALEIQDPRVRPAEKQKAADEMHEIFRHETSDFLSYLKLWDFFHKLKKDLSRSRFRVACQKHFLSVSILHQWQEIHRQLKNVVKQNGLKIHDRKDNYEAIHRCLLAGLLSGIANLTERHEYTGAGGIKFFLWPGSGIFEAKPKWVIAAEVVETSRRYGRTVAKIDPGWIESLSQHLVKRNHVDPHWSRKRQAVMAYENVTLFGLPIVNRRRVGFAKIDPELSRQLFIEYGVVGFELQGKFAFQEHNRSLMENVEKLAAKTRRRDLIIDSVVLEQFFQERIPDACVDAATLNRELKNDPDLDKNLRLTEADLFEEDDPVESSNDFPDAVQIGAMSLPVQYRFEPDQVADGATIQIPQEGLGQIDDAQAGWLIPGLYQSRITAMIRSLPKSIRRNLVPAPETAKRVAAMIEPANLSFPDAVAIELSRIASEPITASMFDDSKIENCWSVNIQVINEEGELVAQGRSANDLRKELNSEAESFIQAEDATWDQDGLREWSWGALPDELYVNRGATRLSAFPAIVDQGDAVGLKLVDSIELAQHLTTQGLTRLYSISLRKKLKRQVNWLPELDQHSLNLSSVISSDRLKAGLADLIASKALIEDSNTLPRSAGEFAERIDGSVEAVSIATQEVAKWMPRFAEAVHSARLAVESLPAKKIAGGKNDIAEQIKHLTDDQFLIQTPWEWLQHYPRYFSSIAIRCEKMVGGIRENDEDSTVLVAEWWKKYEELRSNHKSLSIFDRQLIKFRWMIEEYRVSLFAQQLGTALTISATRLNKQLNRIRKS